jgi:glycine cleavage system H lipoate-binding protein
MFATKGIEYLLVIGFLLVFVGYWIWMSKPIEKVRQSIPKVTQFIEGWFSLVKNYFYHQGHSWAMPEGKNLVKVGIDDFSQKLIGKPDRIIVPSVGERLEQGEKGWQFEIDHKRIDMLSPVAGEIIEINQEVLDNPQLLVQDPYDKGWLLKVRVPKIKSNLTNLLTGNLAQAWMQNTVNQLRGTLSGELGMVMQDGGAPVSGFAKEVFPDKWEDHVKRYLMTE